jgi:hypothetical protein
MEFDSRPPSQKRSVAQLGTDNSNTATSAGTNPAPVRQNKIQKTDKTQESDIFRLSVVKTLIVDQTRTLTGVKTLTVDQTRTLTDISSNLDNQLRETTLELDSHADTCVLGRDALILWTLIDL